MRKTPADLSDARRRVEAWCARWRMRLSVQKCGAMTVGGANRLDAVSVQGAAVPWVDSYRFLGDGYVPVFAKLMAIRSVLMPILGFGWELWGFSTERCTKVQRVADEGLRRVLGVGKPVCLRRLRNELGVGTVSRMAAVARNRAFRKWRGLRTWIADLIAHTPTHRKATWVTGCMRWLRRYARSENRAGPTRVGIQATFRGREEARDRSAVSSWTRAARIGENSWVELGTSEPSLSRGALAIGKMRVGAFPTAQSLARKRRMPAEFLGVCPLCGAPRPETVEDLLLECARWEARRRQFNMATVMSGDLPLAVLAGGHLGGSTRH